MLQAVVVSIDPRRVYLKNPEDVGFKTIRVTNPGKGGITSVFASFYCLDNSFIFMFHVKIL